jgi:hypothetical protein
MNLKDLIMSYTEIYKFNKEGNAECFAEVRNAFRGAMAIWMSVERRYLPDYIPSWAIGYPSGETPTEHTRVADMMGEGLKEIWALFENSKVSEVDKIVLGSTFDNVIVMKKDLPILIKAFREFEGETSLKKQADLIEEVFKNDQDLLAIGWDQTSVNGDAWQSDETVLDENNIEIYSPYNLLKHNKHWDLFNEIKDQKS